MLATYRLVLTLQRSTAVCHGKEEHAVFSTRLFRALRDCRQHEDYSMNICSVLCSPLLGDRKNAIGDNGDADFGETTVYRCWRRMIERALLLVYRGRRAAQCGANTLFDLPFTACKFRHKLRYASVNTSAAHRLKAENRMNNPTLPMHRKAADDSPAGLKLTAETNMVHYS